MPLFLEGHDPADATGRDIVSPIVPEAPKPNLDRPADPFDAAFRQSNPMVSVINSITHAAPEMEPDPNHNPYEAIKGTKYALEPDQFVGSRNLQETLSIIARIDQRDHDLDTLSAAGPAGATASLVAGLLDPTVFLPAGGVIKAAKGGYSLVKTAAAGAAAGVGQSLVSEGILHSSQTGRSEDDLPFVVGSSAVLGGLIGGGAAALLNRGERKAVEAALDADRAAISAQAGLPARPASVGAAGAGDARALEPKPLIPDALRNLIPAPVRETANRWLNSVSPTMRTFFVRDSLEARRAMAELTELAFDMEEHAPQIMRDVDGKPVLGADGQPVITREAVTTTRDGQAPVGRLSQMMQTQLIIEGGDALEHQFLNYRYGEDGSGSMFKAAREDISGTAAPDKMTFGQFKDEVSKALRNGDKHENPFVQAVAEHIRSRIFEPIHQRLVDAKLMTAEDAAPKGDKSFLSRLWDKKVIAEQRPELHKIISDWLEGEQTTKAGLKSRISDLAASRGDVSRQLSKIEGRLKTIERRQAEAAAQQKERVVELNAADNRESDLQARHDEIKAGIAEIEEYIGDLRERATDPEAKMRLEMLEEELQQLRGAEREAQLSQAKLDALAKEEAGSLTGDVKKAAEVLAGRRKAPTGKSFLTYIVEGGGVADGEALDIFKDIKRPGLVRKTRDAMGRGGSVVRDFDDWGERLMEDFPHAFQTRPDRNTVMDIMAAAAGGREPWFWHVDRDGNVAEHVRVNELVSEIEHLADKAGVGRPGSMEDVAKLLHGQNRISILDLMREQADMDAAGAAVPPRISAQVQEALVAHELDARAQLRKEIEAKTRERDTAARAKSREGARLSEARVAVTRSENRFELLKDRQDRQQMMRDLLENARQNAKAEHARLTKALEDEVTSWQGHSSGEAIAAIARRDEAERIRGLKQEAGVYEGSGDRMTSADGAVDRAIRRMLDSDQDLTREDLEARAHEVIDRIMGSPDGRLPYDAASNAEHIVAPRNESLRGSLKNRDFAIPSAMVDKFLVNDIEQVLHTYARTIIPDLLLHERFGDVEMSGEFRKINEEYAAKSMAAETPKQRARIEADRNAAIRDLAAVRDRVRNVYGWPQEQAMPIASRVARIAKNYNTVTDLGTSTLNSLPDIAGAVFLHGFQRVVGDAWAPFLAGMMQGGTVYTAAMKRQARDLLTGLETKLNLRGHALADVIDNYKPGSKIERGTRWLADKSQLANLQAPWTDLTKTMATTVAVAEHMRAIERVAGGKGTAVDREMLARSNINDSMAARIWREYSDGGGEAIDGTPFVDVMKWRDRDARESFMAAIAREADIAVVTPGHERALWHSNPVFSALGQFKSFIGATHERILIPGLQRRDANTLAGVLSATAAGMLSYKLYSIVSGRETSDRPQDWIKEGMSRGGVLGWLDEANNSGLVKLTGGRLDIYRLIGADRPMSRFEQRTAAAALLGPTWGKLEGLIGASSSAFRGDWSRSDTTRLRRLVPFQNLFYLRNLISKAESGINDAFGVPVNKAP